MGPNGKAKELSNLLNNTAWLAALARSLVESDENLVDELVQMTRLYSLEHPESKVRRPTSWLAAVMRSLLKNVRRGNYRRLAREQESLKKSENEPSPIEAIETAEREERYTVLRPVWETAYRDESYNRIRNIVETHEREERYTVQRPQWHTEVREHRYTVRQPVTQTVEQQVCRTVMQPVTTMRTDYVDQGQWVN